MSRTESIVVAKVSAPHEKEACLAIRREVFVEEQKVPAETECDEYEETSLYFLAHHDQKPAGTARVRFKDDGRIAKIERLAVRKAMRGFGVGAAVMRAVETDPSVAEAAQFILHAQSYALPFYERLGYKAEGEEFMEADIPHRFMRKENRRAAQSTRQRTA